VKTSDVLEFIIGTDTPSQFSIPDNAVFDTRNKSSLKLLSSPIASCVPVY
jgi:hypothetical protein